MNQILYTGETKKKKVVYKKEGMLLISALLIIIMVLILSFNIGSINMTSQAMQQQDNILTQQVQQENSIEEEKQVQVVLPNEEKKVEEKKEEQPKKPVTKTIKASNGKKYEVIATLKIPSLNIEYPILSKTSVELLKISLNKYWGADPNEVGNMCVVGHNYEDSRFFGKLHKIKKGAIVKITDMSGKTLDYEVYHTEVIDPYDNACTSQLTNGNTEITLITCYNNGNQRFVVKARANQ